MKRKMKKKTRKSASKLNQIIAEFRYGVTDAILNTGEEHGLCPEHTIKATLELMGQIVYEIEDSEAVYNVLAPYLVTLVASKKRSRAKYTRKGKAK